jgi:threonine dehydratase
MAELSLEQIEEAAQRLDGVAHKTPLVTSSGLDSRCGGRVLVKAEMLQRAGSFKFRGAYNRLCLLSPAQRANGVVAYSSGNHGAAVALAASVLRVPALVVVPETVSRAKLAAIEGYGAEVCRYDPASECREQVARRLAGQRSMTLVPPFDDYDVMAGQGSLGLEIAKAAGDSLDQVLIPVGGGGLAAGVATAITSLTRATVVGVEPAGANDTQRSIRAGHPVSIASARTIADGLRVTRPGKLTFPINQALLSDVVTVEDAAIIETMRFCFSRLKLAVEPSGAAALAAVLAGAVRTAGKTTAVVATGGNIHPADFTALIQAAPRGSRGNL